MSFLKVGESCKIGSLRIGVSNESLIYVTGWSRSIRIEDLTKKRALEELASIKTEFAEILNDSSNQLASVIENRDIKYNLAFNYGMGAIEICHELDGTVYWNNDIKIHK